MNNVITDNLATWTSAPNGIKKLRELILELAVRGLLVPQEANDEPAIELLKKIAKEKARLIRDGEIKLSKPLPKIGVKDKPFSLPKGWEWVRLGEISADIHYGYTASANQNITDVRLLRITDIQNDSVYWPTVPGCEIEQKNLSTYQLENGDLLIARTGGTIGKSYLVENIDVCAVFASYLIRVKRLKSIYPSFIKTYLGSPFYWHQLYENSMGTGQPNVNGNALKNLVCSFPPLSEQHRIVAKVDELMQLCDHLEHKQSSNQQTHRQLVSTLLTTLTEATDAQAFQTTWSHITANFDCLFTTESSIEQLKQTILQLAVMGKLVPQDPNDEPASKLLNKIAAENARLITEGKIKKQNPLPKISEEEKPFALPNGWEWERMGTIFNGGSGTTPLRSQTHYFINGTEHWFKTTDLNLNIVLHGEEKITKQAVEECNLTYYPKDTVCIAMYGGGGTIGKSGILGVSATINQSVFALPPIEQFNSYFLHLYIKSIRSMWMGFAAGLRKDPNINGLIIKKMLLPIPPLAEQHRIVAKVDELMTLCDALKSRINQAQTTQIHLADAIVEQAVA